MKLDKEEGLILMVIYYLIFLSFGVTLIYKLAKYLWE